MTQPSAQSARDSLVVVHRPESIIVLLAEQLKRSEQVTAPPLTFGSL
jgi:hypothetical protein